MTVTQDNISSALQYKFWDAAARGDTATVRRLALHPGIDIDARDEDGFTAFSLATQQRHADTATVILAARELRYLEKLGQAPRQITARQKKSLWSFLSRRKHAS